MILTYDGTFAGLLSAIFESYRLKADVVDIIPEDRYQEQLFSSASYVPTNTAHASRVLKGLQKHSGNQKIGDFLRRTYLTEQPEVERLILYFVHRQMEVRALDISKDAGDDRVRQLLRLSQQMGREIHRMHAFVRFQQTPDGMYVGLINPDFNCLPLIGDHFAARYPAMEWLIYDTRRHYGLHWNQEDKKAAFITLDSGQDGRLRRLSEEMLDTRETDYQELWQTYFRAVDIPERKNLKLHLQHVPKRYWKYLTEKI
ncbi:putative DNA metabolism protein [Neolewinella xylanilytica]|uniref:Putative DNA metabolism protein n=1 Tax=Neolewinella xylanilytica TaxID=1514080 RepID=A0A2S6I9V0_9BACT|nr:TIGR03915 family putative DNA repair protein [Neolewinella xylanilytica]PPK88252.1 putative DNA metabolism protein [Neolewinella xylanilytica]